MLTLFLPRKRVGSLFGRKHPCAGRSRSTGGACRDSRLRDNTTLAPHRAVVFLHGCSGVGFGGGLSPVYTTWARHLNEAGYTVLIVDSATPRGFASTCGPGEARKVVYARRPFHAYGALRYLQSLPAIRSDAIGLMGWSQGGGIALLTIVDQSIGRPIPAPADAPNVRLQERSAPRLRDGSLPLIGTDEAAREDALEIVPSFLDEHMPD